MLEDLTAQLRKIAGENAQNQDVILSETIRLCHHCRGAGGFYHVMYLPAEGEEPKSLFAKIGHKWLPCGACAGSGRIAETSLTVYRPYSNSNHPFEIGAKK